MHLNTFRVYCAVWALALAGSLAYSECFYGVSLYVKNNGDIRVAARSRSRGFDGFRGCFAADPSLSLVKSYRVRVGVYQSMSVSKKKYTTNSSTNSTNSTNDWLQSMVELTNIESTNWLVEAPISQPSHQPWNPWLTVAVTDRNPHMITMTKHLNSKIHHIRVIQLSPFNLRPISAYEAMTT
jgi:hypothetical protein